MKKSRGGPHQNRPKMKIAGETPKICRRKLNFDDYTNKLKKRGKGQNMSENIDLVISG